MSDKKRFAVDAQVRVKNPGVNGVVTHLDDKPTFLGEYVHTIKTEHGQRREPGCNLELVPSIMTNSEAVAPRQDGLSKQSLLAEIEEIRKTMPPRETIRWDTEENHNWFGRVSAAIEKWNPSKSALVEEHLNLFFSRRHARETIQGLNKLTVLLDQAQADLRLETAQMQLEAHHKVPSRKVFIGHGRSLVWLQLKVFLGDRLHLVCNEFNAESVAGTTTTERLQTLLDDSGFAFLVMTAEDGHADGSTHARENVVHEAGLFQGKLGFRRAIILLEDGCAQFSNIHGLSHIGFPKGNLEPAFDRIRHVLERERLYGGSSSEGMQLDDEMQRAAVTDDGSSSEAGAAATSAVLSNLTEEQKDLLQQIVDVYQGGCRSAFIFCEATSTSSPSLLYGGSQPNIAVDADETDFERLATENLLDLTTNSGGELRGKPTALGVRVATILKVERAAQQRNLAKLILRAKSQSVTNDVAGELLKLREFFLEVPELLRYQKNQEFFRKWANDPTISLLAETRASGYWTNERLEELYRDLDALKVGP